MDIRAGGEAISGTKSEDDVAERSRLPQFDDLRLVHLLGFRQSDALGVRACEVTQTKLWCGSSGTRGKKEDREKGRENTLIICHDPRRTSI